MKISKLRVIDSDEQFFTDHPDRQAHIRLPSKKPRINRARGVDIVEECAGEFFSLGPHKKERRRILLWRLPKENPYFDPEKQQILKIPFLAFADETIEDRDDILLPIIHRIMEEAAKGGAA